MWQLPSSTVVRTITSDWWFLWLKSFTQCLLTTDHTVLLNLFKDIQPGIIQDGTAIGLGLANSVSRIKDSQAKSKVIILLTDGVNNAGEIAPVTAAEIAKTFGIRIYAIGVGTQGSAPILSASHSAYNIRIFLSRDR